MKALVSFLLGALLVTSSSASTYCNGKITAVYKWNTMSTLSIQITMSDGSGTVTPWINLPTAADEAMALLAFSASKPVTLYWYASDVTTCALGWADNRALNGFMVVTN